MPNESWRQESLLNQMQQQEQNMQLKQLKQLKRIHFGPILIGLQYCHNMSL